MVASQTPVPNPDQTQGVRVPQTHQTTTKRRKPGTGTYLLNACTYLHAVVPGKTQKFEQVRTCEMPVATCPRVFA